MLVLLAVAMAFGWSYWALLPAFARDVLGQGEFGYAIMYSASGAGAVAGALFVAGHHGRDPQRTVAVFLILVSLALVGSASRTLWLACLCRAVVGFSMHRVHHHGDDGDADVGPRRVARARDRRVDAGVGDVLPARPAGDGARRRVARDAGDDRVAGGTMCLVSTLVVTLARRRRATPSP